MIFKDYVIVLIILIKEIWEKFTELTNETKNLKKSIHPSEGNKIFVILNFK